MISLAAGLSCRAGGPSYVIEQTVAKPATVVLPPGAHAEANDTIVNARFQGVRFHVWKGVALDLEQLSGRMLSQRDDGIVSLDDKTSFVLAIDTGTVGLTVGDLSRLMNTYVFAYRGAPLRDLSFEVDGQHLIQRGILHKGVDIPFEMTGEVSVTAEGEIRVHPVAMKICSINGQGLMNALGITLAKLIDVSGAKGVRVIGNDLFLNPVDILPAAEDPRASRASGAAARTSRSDFRIARRSARRATTRSGLRRRELHPVPRRNDAVRQVVHGARRHGSRGSESG